MATPHLPAVPGRAFRHQLGLGVVVTVGWNDAGPMDVMITYIEKRHPQYRGPLNLRGMEVLQDGSVGSPVGNLDEDQITAIRGAARVSVFN